MELNTLAEDEEGNKKKKKIPALKITNIKYTESGEKDCQNGNNKKMELMLLKFKELLRIQNKTLKIQKQSEETSSFILLYTINAEITST